MRAEFEVLASTYPRIPTWRDPGFSDSPLASLVKKELRAAIVRAIPEAEGRYEIKGSIGSGGWTFTPWVAILDPRVSTSVEDGYYVVYLLSLGGQYLFLSINQGCTTLKNAIGTSAAKDELRRRAELMWSRIHSKTKRLSRIEMDLHVNQSIWRGKLYEAGLIAGVKYETANLPSEDAMIDGLREALSLYLLLEQSGGWSSEDEMIGEAKSDDVGASLEQAKLYRQHRSIERLSSHSRKVKKAQGTRCKGCQLDLTELYGPLAKGVIDAHHLVPLNSLNQGDVVRLNPKKDFAVLCPNCHRIVHRMDDCSDIEGLRALVKDGMLAKLSGL